MPPIERRAGVGLAARSDVGVPDDVDDRIAPAQRRSELSEAQVLLIGVGLVVAALELDSTAKSLQRSRPCQLDGPACQARFAQGTNWISSPSRRSRKCADTLRSRRVP